MTKDDEFEGVTYISHGGEHEERPTDDTHAEDEASTPRATPAASDDKLMRRLDALEKEFVKYKVSTDKKLKVLEKLAKKNHISPEERFYTILEDS